MSQRYQVRELHLTRLEKRLTRDHRTRYRVIDAQTGDTVPDGVYPREDMAQRRCDRLNTTATIAA